MLKRCRSDFEDYFYHYKLSAEAEEDREFMNQVHEELLDGLHRSKAEYYFSREVYRQTAAHALPTLKRSLESHVSSCKYEERYMSTADNLL